LWSNGPDQSLVDLTSGKGHGNDQRSKLFSSMLQEFFPRKSVYLCVFVCYVAARVCMLYFVVCGHARKLVCVRVCVLGGRDLHVCVHTRLCMCAL